MRLFLIAALIVTASSAKAQFEPPEDCNVIQKTVFKKSKLKICGKTLDVETADNEPLRAVGLMCRDSMPENSGMLFVFEFEKPLSFWMKNTRLPLSIGYFGKNKRLIDTYEMKPMSETDIYTSKKYSMYALEANKGWFAKNKIHPGCKLEFVKEASKPKTKAQ
jgi:uncharacterized membrane protein (UPF0127 family)